MAGSLWCVNDLGQPYLGTYWYTWSSTYDHKKKKKNNNNNKPGCATEDTYEVYNCSQTTTGTHP
jgi:hypothetical protein